MILLFFLMFAGYAFGTATAVLSPQGRAVRRGAKYFMQSIEYRSEIVPWFERYLYAPLVDWMRVGAVWARAIQSGSVHAYLTYLVLALVGLLTLLLVWGA